MYLVHLNDHEHDLVEFLKENLETYWYTEVHKGAEMRSRRVAMECALKVVEDDEQARPQWEDDRTALSNQRE